jgi:flagellar biosynthesis GTPase FlhF
VEFIGNCEVQSCYADKFHSAKISGDLSYEDITSLISNISLIKEERDWFTSHEAVMHTLFAQADNSDNSDWLLIERGLDTAEKLRIVLTGNIPEAITKMACSGKEIDSEFGLQVSSLTSLVERANIKLVAFSKQFSVSTFEDEELETVAVHYDSCINGFGELNKWLDYVEAHQECDNMGLADFTTKIAEMDNAVSDVQAAFEREFYIQWLKQELENVPAVQSFRRRVHEQRSERFVKLDVKQYEIARKRIRQKIISTYPNLNRVSRAGSELGILRHEMEKKRRIMPLRKLFQSIPTLLLTLKPCLMMSPLSVAYFLDAGAYQFDMVIFDEASQIFPQDAIGAIFRGKQVIIAGDTKQLPPTNFFAANTSNSSGSYDDDEGYDEEVYDSILEETANILPNRTLLWHYRSKHEHLIAFSNQEIYKNELVTFPSSNESEPDTGVEFIYVEDGYYESSPRNYNILEARRIVELVREHIEKHPDRSLGIIAFSEKQQQAISLEIQRFREKHSEYEAFFAEGKEDEFFVKNLENVQGDERDTIIFSVGYAKTKEQKANGKPMSMRFGPLGVSGGERRLNVAITRAKINVKLVSSILPSDIDLSRTESDGIRMLRSYIEFAMNGATTLAAAHHSTQPDDFADSIADYLRSQNFEVQQYVGCSGYKIDIAVKHPSKTVEQFVAGVECDGFSYVSARTARDRDRLRSSVLKSMGWNLYRVWSAEWYKNPEIEGQKLVAFLHSAIRACDEKIKALEEQKRKEEEIKRAECEKAIAAREAEERRKQREKDAAEAKLRAEREKSERKRREDDEKKAAKLKADRETAKQREEERERLEDHRRKAEEAKQQTNDLAWVKPGAHVTHTRYGVGAVLDVSKDIIKVRFGQSEKVLSYPSTFERGILTKAVSNPDLPKAKGFEWAIVGAKVSHKTFGDGVIDTIDGTHMSVRFGNVVKTFLYPGALADGHLTKGTASDTALKEQPTSTANDMKVSLIDALKNAGFTFIDNRTTSSILWVIYESVKENDFEKIVARYDVQYKLEKRGALATNNSPAWRIMFT